MTEFLNVASRELRNIVEKKFDHSRSTLTVANRRKAPYSGDHETSAISGITLYDNISSHAASSVPQLCRATSFPTETRRCFLRGSVVQHLLPENLHCELPIQLNHELPPALEMSSESPRPRKRKHHISDGSISREYSIPLRKKLETGRNGDSTIKDNIEPSDPRNIKRPRKKHISAEKQPVASLENTASDHPNIESTCERPDPSKETPLPNDEAYEQSSRSKKQVFITPGNSYGRAAKLHEDNHSSAAPRVSLVSAALREFYQRRSASDDYGPKHDPEAIHVGTPRQERSDMPYTFGLYQGVNRLQDRSATDLPRTTRLAEKAFDLHKDTYNPPSKRAKLSQSLHRRDSSPSSPANSDSKDVTGAIRNKTEDSSPSADLVFDLSSDGVNDEKEKFTTRSITSRERRKVATGRISNRSGPTVRDRPVLELESVKVEVDRPTSSFMGNRSSRLKSPPRSEKSKNGADRALTLTREPQRNGLSSHHFSADASPDTQRHQKVNSKNSIVNPENSAARKRSSGRISLGSSSLDVESIDDSDELASTIEVKPKVESSRARNEIMKPFAKSASLSTTGDIRNSLGSFGKDRFPIAIVITGRDFWKAATGSTRNYVRLDPSSRELQFHVAEYETNSEIGDMKVQVSSIEELLHNDSEKICMKRPSTNGSVPAQICVEFSGEGESARFRNALGLRDGIATPVLDDRLEKIFGKTRKDAGKLLQRSESIRGDGEVAQVETNAGKRSSNFNALDQVASAHKYFSSTSQQTPELKHRRSTRAQMRATYDLTERSVGKTERQIPEYSDHPVRWTEEHRGWEKSWSTKSVLFPVNGKNQTQVDRQDIERLDEGEFLNDNLITYYLRILEEKAKLRSDYKALFMSTFFYERLTNMKGRNGIDYDAVKRWTAKIDLFSYDYMVVPVNENAHWYLAIICNLPNLFKPEGATLDKVEESSSRGNNSTHPALNRDSSTAGLGRYPGSIPNVETIAVDSSMGKMSLEDDQVSDDKRIANEKEFTKEESRLPPHHQHEPESIRSSTSHPTHGWLTEDQPKDVTDERASRSSPCIEEATPRKSNNLRPFKDPTFPVILTFDSLGAGHRNTSANLRAYIINEAREKRGQSIGNKSIRLQAVGRLQQQTNFCDCGLFLLAYAENFLDNPQRTLKDILCSDSDMSRIQEGIDASQMRRGIRESIFTLQLKQAESELEARRSSGTLKGKRTAKTPSQDKHFGDSEGIVERQETHSLLQTQASAPVAVVEGDIGDKDSNTDEKLEILEISDSAESRQNNHDVIRDNFNRDTDVSRPVPNDYGGPRRHLTSSSDQLESVASMYSGEDRHSSRKISESMATALGRRGRPPNPNRKRELDQKEVMDVDDT